MRTTRDLWHAAGRAARDDRKRLLALQGVLWSAPVLALGAMLSRLPDPALTGLKRPLHYVLEPLRQAWRGDQDLALLGYVSLQILLLALLWGFFGGAVHRLAAVELTQGRREDGRLGLEFSRRHWRSFVGARVAIWMGILVPLAAAAGLAAAGRLPGWIGGVLLVLAVGGALAAAIAAVVVASVNLVAGFLPSPTVACEDSDAFDAVSRTFTYASSGLPRLVGYRLLFLGGVLLGAGWRLLRSVGVALLGFLVLRAGAGAGALEGALAILGATGEPADASRLGLEPYHYGIALALAFAAGTLVVFWLADLVTRVICGRTAVYLLLRRDIERVPLSELRTAPRSTPHLGAEEAGFVEVSRIDGAPAGPGRVGSE